MMNKKKVIFVTGSLGTGGAERVISILASGCADLGAEVTLVVLREQSVAYSVSDKVNLIQIKSRGKLAAFHRIKQLHTILKNNSAGYVIPFMQVVSLYTLIANIGVWKKIIMSERNDPNVGLLRKELSLKNKIGYFFMITLGLHKLAHWTVFQTPDAQAWYSKKVQARSCIIPNPLDGRILPKRYEGDRDHLIVAAGRLVEQKNFALLIKGFKRFYETHRDYQLIIYGEGELQQELMEQSKLSGIDNAVFLPGFSKKLHEDIHQAAMYVSTSNFEGISNSMLEALGMGIPTIVTDCPAGGAKMFVKTDINGILIPMNDEDALVSAMCKIADNRDFAHRISEEAVKIKEELDARTICEQWLSLV
ncbi:glycosyltransferase [Eisenbergiella tayi]|uniref:glycosyltransferase n=1 Tax=Eisenbergiella tayi TaxID=1432052 RepID=UPI00138E1661|nr:glycosyltransferase [Eisenbergiella tayi]